MLSTKKLRKIILSLILICLTSCKTVNFSFCPEINEYTLEQQQELDKILKNNNNSILNQFIIDYGVLREQIRECYNEY